MDSMDYEAMRCVSVDEISNTIKERGMNNLLAERIQVSWLNSIENPKNDHHHIQLQMAV